MLNVKILRDKQVALGWIFCSNVDHQVAEVKEYRELEQKLADARSLLLVYRLYVNEVRAGETQQKNEAAQKQAEDAEKKNETQLKKIRESKEELVEVETRLSELEEEKEKAKLKEVRFTSKQKMEYQRLKQQASAIAAGLKASVTSWERKESTLVERLKETELGRLNKRREVINELKEAFPNSIFGPMNELFEPSQRKYAVAVNAALGKFAECIAIDTFETGKKAVDYLRRRKRPPLEFAPLDSLSRASVDPRLYSSSLQRLCKSSLDCIQYDPMYEPAFRTALHDSVIVDDLRVAEQLAYVECPKMGLKVKVVTLDGEKVLKNGNITVDTALRHNNRADAQELKVLSKRLSEVELALRRKEDLGELKQSVDQLVREIGELESSLKRKKEKVEMWENKQIASTKELECAQISLERQSQDKINISEELQRCREELEKIRSQVLRVEDEIFAPLAAEVNIADLRKFEEEQKAAAKAKEVEKDQLVRRLQKLRSTTGRLESDIVALDPKSLEKQIKEIDKKLKKDVQALEEAKTKKIGMERSAEEAKESLDQFAKGEKLREAKIKEEKELLRIIQKEKNWINGEIKLLNSKSEVLYKEAVDLLRSALLDNLNIPLSRGTLRGYCRLLGLEDVMRAAVVSQTQTQDENGDAVMSITDGSAEEEETPEINYEKVLSSEILDVRRK
ncbi:structural maintenance of chromosomes protein 1A-like [Condylostylus longicornis]|uniref:structural maintenance of chromosomes protein 1A-like n=1 Tax=Condylostylus longicornis TaxID=2530218 RepID=UPI00244E1592|nr:structural maintenance of chromosomes protein 1A-like [Condylostylus longicornis]